MKNLFLVCLALSLAGSVQSQRQSQRTPAVYVTITGNKDYQVAIDGTTYNLNNVNSTVSKTNTPINTLSPGMHTLTLTRTANNNRRAGNYTTQFNLRRNFDMYINLNANGSVELIEKRNNGTATSRTPMSNNEFSTLTRNLRLQRTAAEKNTLLTNTFTNPATNLSSIQVVQLLQQVRSESDRLPLAKLSFRTVTDPNNFSPVYGLFSVQANRNELEEFVNYYDEEVPADNTTVNNNTQGTDFNSIYQNIKGQWPSSVQVTSLTTAFNTPANYFTASQVSQLIQLVSGEGTRLQLAKLAYDNVVDPVNYNTVSSLLYSQSSRDDLGVFIGSGTTVNTRTAMPEAEYNTLYQSVTAQFLPFAKMNALTTIFNTGTNYFSTSQAKNLIQLVSSESNRLQLAKSAYRNIVDRANFSQVYDLFTTPSYKTDLQAYVAAYRD